MVNMADGAYVDVGLGSLVHRAERLDLHEYGRFHCTKKQRKRKEHENLEDGGKTTVQRDARYERATYCLSCE